MRDLISTFKGMAPFLAQDSHVKAWISCSINIRDDYCILLFEFLQKTWNRNRPLFMYAQKKGQFHEFIELFSTGIIMNLAVVGVRTPGKRKNEDVYVV